MNVKKVARLEAEIGLQKKLLVEARDALRQMQSQLQSQKPESSGRSRAGLDLSQADHHRRNRDPVVVPNISRRYYHDDSEAFSTNSRPNSEPAVHYNAWVNF